MAKQYREKPETGYEYVTASKDLLRYTMLLSERLPKSWYDILVKHWLKQARKLVNQTVKANVVYVSSQNQNPEEFIEAIKRRDKHLMKAIAVLRIYNERFQEVLDQIDIKREEVSRLKNEITELIKKTYAEHGGEVEGLSVEIGHDEFYYVSISGNERKRISFGPRQKDKILDLYNEAEKQIQQKLTKDRSIIKNIKKKIDNKTDITE